jgi:hypothetical protein
MPSSVVCRYTSSSDAERIQRRLYRWARKYFRYLERRPRSIYCAAYYSPALRRSQARYIIRRCFGVLWPCVYKVMLKEDVPPCDFLVYFETWLHEAGPLKEDRRRGEPMIPQQLAEDIESEDDIAGYYVDEEALELFKAVCKMREDALEGPEREFVRRFLVHNERMPTKVAAEFMRYYLDRYGSSRSWYDEWRALGALVGQWIVILDPPGRGGQLFHWNQLDLSNITPEVRAFCYLLENKHAFLSDLKKHFGLDPAFYSNSKIWHMYHPLAWAKKLGYLKVSKAYRGGAGLIQLRLEVTPK